MASRADNIISFDDVRRASYARSSTSARSYSSSSAAASGASGGTYAAEPSFERDFRTYGTGRMPAARPAAASSSPRASRPSDTASVRKLSLVGSNDVRSASSRRASTNSQASTSRMDFSAFDAFEGLDEELMAADGTFDGTPRAALEVYDPELDKERDTRKRGLFGTSKKSKAKAKNKAKADKMFARQFGDAPASDSGPRAAVYKGEMGKAHKRAFEDLGGNAGERAGGGLSVLKAPRAPKGKANRIAAPKWAVLAGAFVCVAVAALFLYPTAQQYYIELREYDKLQAEYEALVERNAAIQSDIDYLSTDEGIMDAAREELGWVEEGETAVVVSGLSDDEEEESASDTVYAQVTSGSVATPTTWYSTFLDPLFGYSDE